METRAPYVIVGAFVLAAIAAVFGFVYWLNNSGGTWPPPTDSQRRGARCRPGLSSQNRPPRRACRPSASLFAGGEEREDDFANAQWSDGLPALIQAKLLQSFENYDIAHAPVRADLGNEGGLRLLIDLRQFEITGAPELRASIALSAKLVDSGHVRAARIFQQSAPLDGLTRQRPPHSIAPLTPSCGS